MSDDIVARLRLTPVLMYTDKLNQSRIDYEACKKYINNEGVKMMREAADEIERLRKRWRDGDGLVSRLRELERDLLNEGADLSDAYYIPTIGEAADEIERLREIVSRMEAKR